MSFADWVKEKKKKEQEEEKAKNTQAVLGGKTSFSDWVKEKKVSSVDQTYINTFITDADNFLGSAEEDYKNMGWSNASTTYRTKRSTWNDLEVRASHISEWLNRNKGKLDADTYKSLSDALSNFQSAGLSIVGNLEKANNYYAQFKSEEDYKKNSIGWLNPDAERTHESVSQREEYYQSNENRIDEIEDELPWYAKTWLPNFVEDIFLSKDKEALRDEAESREAENTQYKRTQGVLDKYYQPVTDEFKQNASHRDYSNASKEELWNYDMSVLEGDVALTNGGYFDDEGNIRDSKGNIVMSANAPEIQDKLGMFLSAVADGTMMSYVNELSSTNGNYTNTWANLMQEGDTNGWRYLEENEIAIYYDLYKREGQEAAYKFLKDMTTELTRRETQAMTDSINDAPLLAQIALNIASVPLNVFGGVTSFVDDITNVVKGEDINPYSRFHAMQNAGTAIRQDTASDINNLTGNASLPWLGTTWGDVYQNLMSTADSAVGLGMGGNAYGVLMGMGAASAEMKDLYEKGASTGQIVAGGILAGAAELIFEKYSIDSLVSMNDANSMKAVIINALKQGGVEASEEMLTEIANTISNYVIMGSQSDWVDVETFVKNVVNAGLGGFMSGGLMGGIVSDIEYNQRAKTYGNDIINMRGTDTLKQLALEMSANKGGLNARNLTVQASKVANKATAKNVGQLAMRMDNTVSSQNRSDIENALVEKGLSKKDAKRVSEYLNKVSQGYEFSDKEAAEVEGNDKIIEVLRDVIADSSSSINERTKRLASAKLGLEYKASSDKAKAYAQPPEEESVTENPTAKENPTEAKFEASTDGKTRIGDLEVSIKEIASVKDGEVTLRLDDGSTVNASDVEYGSSNEALLYENVADMNLNAATANAFIKGYDPSMSVEQYALGFREAYRYGEYGFPVQEMSAKGFSAMLSESQKSIAYNLGKTDAKYKVETKQAKIASTSAINAEENATKATKKGKVHYGEGILMKSLTQRQQASLKGLEVLAEALGVDIHIFESSVVNGKRQGANGWYDPSDNSIHLDLHAGFNGEGTILFTAAHELTHFIRAWSPAKFKVFADFLLEQYGESGISVSELIAEKIKHLEANGRTKGKTEAEIYDLAYEEVVADSCESFLADGDVVAKIAELKAKDQTLWQKIKDFLTKLVAKIKSAYEGMTPDSVEGGYVSKMLDVAERLKELWTEALVEASEVYSTSDVSTDVVSVEDTTKYSYRSLAEAAGFEAVEDEDGTRHFIRNGKAVSEVTVEDIENSPIGAFINYSLDMKDITDKQAKEQKEMFAKVCTMACQTNDFAMAMQFVGSAVFTGMKANADKQYGTTYDFPSICTKTQAVIDAMSKRMVTLGRGLNSDEIVGIYRDVFASGNPVPCPECYVFSRWIGIGGLLDNIKKYQDYYGDMSVTDVAKAYKEMHSQVSAFAEEQKLSFGKAKGALTSKLTKEFNKLTDKIEKQENQGEKVSEADRKRLAEIEPMMNTVKAMTWIENVYFADSALTKVNPNFRVPNEILFDLNKGEAFASQYKEAWAFRTTQGAGYGKAITPYAEARLGEGVLVTNNTTNAIKGKAQGTLKNYFLQQKGQMDAQSKKALDNARAKQKNQAFIGGQRFQSTSDARYENASDYLLAALEMQAMHGMVQVYTKVDGAVAAFEIWGFSTNQSLMPKGGGLDANGKVQDTSVGGMHPRVATENRNKHEHAGTITIGVNDNHIRALYKEVNRDFVIPYHASGGKADVVAEFRTIQEGMEKRGEMVRSTDYSRTQGDKVLSDDVLSWLGKSEAEIEQIHKVREARIGILTRGKVDMDVVRGNRFLSALYDKLHGGEWDGVKLAKGKVASQIFPNEFWDQSVSYEESGKVTKDYLEYCDDLGFLHRFSGLVPSNGMLVSVKGYDENGNKVTLTDLAYKYDENGQKTDVVEDFYWKNITDRRMYGHNGQYLPQKYVTLADTTKETVTSFAKNNYGRQYDKKLSMETAEKVKEKKYEKKYSDRILMGSLFSGGGTLEAGLAYQMLDKEFGVEYDGKIASVYADNHGDHIQVGRVEDFDISKYDDIFYLHASPVCHNFSKAKHGAKELQMDIDSAKATAQHLETAKPQVFTVENAPGYRKSQSLQIITDKLTELGYKWDVDVYNSADYGSATSRNRVILRAVKDGELPAKPTKQERTNSWDKVTRDLWETLPKSYLRPSFISAIENTKNLPILDANGKVNVNKPLLILTTTSGHMVTYCWEGEICPTLTTKCGEAKLVMPDGNIYAVTPEFMGRIQGLPDDYKYPKAKTRAFTIIGNGIPTHLTKAVVGGVLDSAYEQTHDGKVLYSDRASYAPTFYSYMGNVVDGIKSEKVGANGVVPYLKGKGVKAEEIKWSGIETFLEGKKSVTKAELKEFVAGSQLTIEEKLGEGGAEITLEPSAYAAFGEDSWSVMKGGELLDTYTWSEDSGLYESDATGGGFSTKERVLEYFKEKYGSGDTRWEQYTLNGGTNYRELVFKMPNSSYSNSAMRVHWGGDAKGVLAHARIQDMTTSDGKKMLFVEEIQSDWHNEGHQNGYAVDSEAAQRKEKLDGLYHSLSSMATLFRSRPEGEQVKTFDKFAKEFNHLAKEIGLDLIVAYEHFGGDPNEDMVYTICEDGSIDVFEDTKEFSMYLQHGVQDAEHVWLYSEERNNIKAIPDAPFRDTYHEYVLKRLLRMAAEEGYDSIGWTPSEIQSKRWSEEFAEGYRIEYDQDIPKFLRKYGKKWGVTVGTDYVNPAEDSNDLIADIEKDIDGYRKQIAEIGEEASENEYIEFLTEGIAEMQKTIERLRGTKVWSMDITDSMKDSVLHEGQVLYSDRVTDKKTLDFLNKQLDNGEVTKVYRAMQAQPVDENGNVIKATVMRVVSQDPLMVEAKTFGKNGKVAIYPAKLFSPMAGVVNGKWGKSIDLNEWEETTFDFANAYPKIDKKTGKPKIDKDKNNASYGEIAYYYGLVKGGIDDNGKKLTPVPARYNPYIHTSLSALNDQFSSANKRPELVTVECIIPNTELTSGFRAEGAKDRVGAMSWHSGPTSSRLAKVGKARTVILTRYDMPVRVLPDSEVAKAVTDYIGDTKNIAIQGSTVTPSLSRELMNLGISVLNEEQWSKYSEDFPVETFGANKYSDRTTDSVSNRTLLANALESVAQNDIERNKLNQYKQKIALIESEQAKLAEVRAKIKELSFAKGARDTKAIKNLQFEANQTANRINTYDKQLLNLESTKALKDVLQREKQMAYKRAEKRGKEALSAYREKATKTQRELMTRYQESRKKNIEGRKQTAMRHKIKDVVSELNQYLLKGTKDKHVPIELQKAVAEALDAVNMDTVGAEERLAEIHKQLQKDPFNSQLLERYRRIAEQGERMDEKLQALKNAYDEIVNSKDPLIANSHDEVISNSIAKVIKEVGSTPLRDMTLTQLESVYDMYKMVLTTIRNTNKAFKAEKGKEISVLANTVISDLDGKKRNPLNLLDTDFVWNNLKPVYAFERIGSNTLTKLFNAVREGEDVWAKDMSEAQAFREEQSKKYTFDSWDFEKKYPFTTHRGTPFELNLGEMMSIYAFAKDEHSKGHLIGEGFVFDPKKEAVEKVKGKIKVKVNLEDATSYNLSEEIVEDIKKTLFSIPGAKEFVDVMQDYLSTTMGEKGNEVSLELYDIKLFKNKNYFPLKVAPQYMAVAKEQAQGDVKIKNKGFTKDRKEGAKNSIVLSSFMDVWAGHVNEMSMYHAFTLPLEDFYRVFHYKTPKMEGYAPMSVNASIQNAYGTGATQYIDQLLKDLNGGARVDPTVGAINKLTGLFKKSAVFASASVVVQQPSAIARATALVDTKYFVGKPSGKHRDTWAEVKKYAPVAIIKEMGYFDTGMGKASVEWLKGEKTWKDKVDDVVSKAPALADEYAWCAIWDAVKRETLSTHKDLKPNSEEFLNAVGERFTEVITKTQVYDSVLSRSAYMRSKDTGMKMATAFMGEPTTSINMLQDAWTQGKRGNKRYARKAIGGVVSSMILNSILVSIVYAGRDDDEDKTYIEKYIGTLTEELLDSFNPLTLIPFVKDIVSIVQGYDVERSDMAVITDLINAWNNLDNDNRSAYRKVEDFAGAIASLFGLPVKNIMRDARGMYNTVNSFINGEKTTGAGIKDSIVEAVTGNEKSNGQQLYEAILSGDSTQIERVKSRFKDQKAINSAIRTALRENDPRIKEAAEARYNGDIAEYMRIAKKIIAEGNFSQDDIVSAINSEINALKKDEGTSDSSTSSNKVTSIYKMSDYYSALVGRDQATAYAVKEDLIKTDVANGKDREEAESNFNSNFASHLRELYEKGEINSYNAENMLVNYGGKSYEEASTKVQYWAFKQSNPNTNVEEDWFTEYHKDGVSDAGISIEMFVDYRNRVKGITGETKKEDRMAVINSLPITSAQKDALYFAEGWAESKLWQAPWH